MAWSEQLSENCPPAEAIKPRGLKFYRICSNPVSERDFYSHKRLYPEKNYTKLCEAKGLSLWQTLDKARQILKMPIFKSRNSTIGELVLNEKDGVVLQTTKDLNHFTWWSTTEFEYSNNCKLVS
ncbi:hypothetical protein [Dyadobacter arcticus]|uniref:Uncharacterized protein n=1 Tax=Dyadobacter arcticus TaxID=1078754 RepID=A0ABX0UPD2_9BACT|nr:hypothetical protein [Dyadobacter arcticus]NIJ54717.1 hypothetical protein [Dyadobacter arcticus]